MIKCVMVGCNKMGDEEYMDLHMSRDHGIV